MSPAVLRIIDANLNRAREALRVLEDYARFALDRRGLCESLKRLRHDLAGATEEVARDAILWRDTPGDVGTTVKTSREESRDSLNHVVIAAGKRLGEALRTIEESLKTVDPNRASQVESIRYRFYEIERQIAFTLRPVACLFANVRLYVLITEGCCKRPWLEVARGAIEGGADCIQLREKELDGRQLLDRARQLALLCRKHNVISIINDRADVALLSGSDGVHLGQDDLPATEARKLLGTGKIIGVSTHHIAQASQAVLDGADYIGVGPFFRSKTKTRDFVAGPQYAQQVAQEISIPSVAIAGICCDNVDQVLATGMKSVAVTSDVCAADDPREATRRLRQKVGPPMNTDKRR
jgi:thiamine-phosphate pyrophosphorylase